MTSDERAVRARQAAQALEFIAPAFEHLKGSYAARMMELASSTPWEAKKMTALAQAIRVTEVAQAQLQSLIADGPEAQRDLDFARAIEKISDPDRRLLNIGAWR